MVAVLTSRNLLLPMVILVITTRLGFCERTTMGRTATLEPYHMKSPKPMLTTPTMVKSNTLATPTPKPYITPSTLNNGTIKPATLAPSSEVKYKMNLTGVESAILDSTLLFKAALIPGTNISTNSDWPVRFIYQWMNMANMEMERTFDGLTSEIPITFSSERVAPGDYTITVAAFLEDNPAKMIAFETRKFELTEKLNGHLIIYQDLEYQRNPRIFSTKKPLQLFADVHDHFKTSFKSEYFWYQNSSILKKTTTPNLTMTVDTASKFILKSQILVSAWSEEKERVIDGQVAFLTPNTDLQGHVVANESQEAFTKAPSLGADPGNALDDVKDFIDKIIWGKTTGKPEEAKRPFFKDGTFTETVLFKDPLDSCVVHRVDSKPDDPWIVVGVPATINITCNGSAPLSVCLNITVSNATIPVNESCQPVNFTDTVQQQVKVLLNSTGPVYVHFYVYNDVSLTYSLREFAGYDPASVNVPALILPVVFGVFGIFIVLAGVAYIMRLRKKPLVEVADFDFHPTLTASEQSEVSVRISKVVNTIKFMFSRDRYQATHTDPQKCSSSSALTTEVEGVGKLYDSL